MKQKKSVYTSAIPVFDVQVPRPTDLGDTRQAKAGRGWLPPKGTTTEVMGEGRGEENKGKVVKHNYVVRKHGLAEFGLWGAGGEGEGGLSST